MTALTLIDEKRSLRAELARAQYEFDARYLQVIATARNAIEALNFEGNPCSVSASPPPSLRRPSRP